MKYNLNYEFILSNNSPKTYKKLLKIENIFEYLDFFEEFKYNEKFLKVIKNFGKNISHIGIDKKNNIKKLYISLYDFDFKKSLKIITEVKKILNIKEKYFLEKNFEKFDCIGLDFLELNEIHFKIYEIIKKDYFLNLPDFIDKNNIKEIGYLKDFFGRKKVFYRFKNYENIEKFRKFFDLSRLDKIKKFNLEENKNFNNDFFGEKIILKKVKYFCLEGNKKEIYFI